MASNLPSTQKEDWSLNDIVLPEHTNSWGSAINKLTKAMPIYASNGNYYKVQSFSNNIITLSPVIDKDDLTNETVDSYVDGMQVIFQSTFDTTEGCSVNINNLGAKQIKTVKNKPISTGDITLGNFVQLIYNKNADVFYLAGQSQDSNRSGVELCTILCMPFGVDESENKYRYLNGQTIVQSQYPAFTAKVKSWQSTRANLFTTEEEWQAIKTASKLGQCGKFVIDDEAGTIRLPAIVNINGLTDLSKCGLIKDESLPAHKHTRGTMEITGSLGTVHQFGYTDRGAFYRSWTGTKSGSGGGNGDWSNWEFRASRNWTGSTSDPDNATYQADAPVQQEAVQYPYVICVNTGVEEAERPINNYQVNNVYSFGVSQYYKGTMNNASWLKSDGQWNSGTVYTGLYTWVLQQLNAKQFDPSKITVVGSPTITDDGVASGWSLSNYVKIPDVQLQSAETWEIECILNLKQAQTNGATWLSPLTGNGLMLPIYITDTYFKFQLYLSSSSSDWDIAQWESSNIPKLTRNVYKFNLKYTGTQYIYTITNVTTGEIVVTKIINSTTKIYQSPTQLGVKRSQEAMSTDNSIDLSQFSITVDGKEVFSPTKRLDGFKRNTENYDDYDFVINTAEQTFRLPLKNGQEGVFANEVKGDVPSGYNLYYYCGETLQNADLINIARMQEQITDINTQSRGYLVESYTDGTSGYRLYSDGFCEQRGYSNVDSNTLRTITFLKPYKDTNYVVTLGASNINDNNQNSRIAKVASITTKNMVVTGIFNNALGADFHFYWRTCGYVK